MQFHRSALARLLENFAACQARREPIIFPAQRPGNFVRKTKLKPPWERANNTCIEVHEVLKKLFPLLLCHLRVSFSIPASIILVVDQTMPHFQVYKHNFGARSASLYSAASSAFQEFFPFSPATMKSFKINLPFPVLSSTAKIVRTK